MGSSSCGRMSAVGVTGIQAWLTLLPVAVPKQRYIVVVQGFALFSSSQSEWTDLVGPREAVPTVRDDGRA